MVFASQKESYRKLQQDILEKNVKKNYEKKCVITPELIKVQWLPNHQRIDFKVIILTRIVQGLTSLGPYIMDMLQVGAERRHLRSK